MNYNGVIIEESLENKDVLKDVKVFNTEIEMVTEKHETPWISQWTKRTVELPENEVEKIAEKISHSLDRAHGSSWYADFKNDTHHYIIFRDKVFCVNRKSKEEYDEAERYGLSLGIPGGQLINFEGEYKDAV
ncbi:MAG: hypothetical protein NT093_00185 [Candidatus Moranbacteria bacterium]|nr:hypothetical protein [Candidatus Moranbacteria bacterium]